MVFSVFGLTGCEEFDEQDDFTPTEGIDYQLVEDSYAVVTVYQGTEPQIIIADEYMGLPVTTIEEGAFLECDFITSIATGNEVTTIYDYAFSGCDNLAVLVLGNKVMTIRSSNFSGCNSLTNIEVSKDNPHYTSIDGNLYSKDGKTFVRYATGKKDTSFEISETVTTIGADAFYACKNLTGVVIPTSVTAIGQSAFSHSSLTSVVIPESVTTISSYAFFGCESLVNVVISDSVTNIDHRTFMDCTSLTSVVIPDSVTSIDSDVFLGCESLTDVYYTGSEEEWAKLNIASGNTNLTDATIHYNYAP